MYKPMNCKVVSIGTLESNIKMHSNVNRIQMHLIHQIEVEKRTKAFISEL